MTKGQDSNSQHYVLIDIRLQTVLIVRLAANLTVAFYSLILLRSSYMSLQMITCLLLLVVTGEAFELSKVTLDGMSCQGSFLDSDQPMIRWEYRCPAG